MGGSGVFRKLGQAGVAAFDELQGIDWDWLALDGAMTKAPLGGENNRPPSDRPGQERRKTERADGGARRADRGGSGGSEPAR
jgi:hypothetical protein